ncbi:MAG: TerB family tellurite resistance protein [Bauldia sp.]|nr:TerB family tellurite resistance protein [Bauldia sp.]
MISALKRFIADLAGEPEPKPVSADTARLAAAALLYHVIAIDGVVEQDELKRLRVLLKDRFALGDADVDDLVAAAEAADKEAIDLYGFTSVLKQRLDIAERERIVGMMWELVFADGAMHEFEDNLIWRAAELLGVASEARIRLKQVARGDGVA